MKKLVSFIAFMSMLLSMACSVQMNVEPSPAVVSGSFNIFLQPLPQEAHLVSFTIKELAVRGSDGSEISLPLLQDVFPAEKLIGKQKRLLTTVLPPGRYEGLILRLSKATLRGEDGDVDLLVPEEPLVVDHQFTIIKDRAETLFLSLSPDRLVTNGVLFTPKFSLWSPERLLTNLKGFASNSGSGSITVFDKRNVQVIGSISPGASPRGMILDQKRGWLYVALSNENSVLAIEVSNGEILGNVRLRFGDEPSELVLSPSGNTLLSLNKGSSSVSIIDTGSLYEKGRVKLTSDPSWLIMGRDEGRAYVIQSSTGSLSVLDLSGKKVRASVDLEDPPVKGTMNAAGTVLYLVTDFSGNLLAVDAATLAITKKIFIGGGGRSIKHDPTTGLLYIGKESGEIAVVDPASLMLIDSFVLDGPVQHMTIDNEENAIFAVMPRSRKLQKIDLVSKELLGSLELEMDGHTVVVMGER